MRDCGARLTRWWRRRHREAQLLRPTWPIALVGALLLMVLLTPQSREVLGAAAEPPRQEGAPLLFLYLGALLYALTNWYCARALLYMDYRRGGPGGIPRVAQAVARSAWGGGRRRGAARLYGVLPFLAVSIGFAQGGIWTHALGAVFAGVLFFTATVLRRRLWLAGRDVDWVQELPRETLWAALLLLAVNGGVFLWLLVFPVAGAQWIGAGGIVLFCFAGWVVLGSALVHVSYAVFYRRWWPRPAPFALVLGVALLAEWAWPDDHPLRTADCELDGREECVTRPETSLEGHFREWLALRGAGELPVVLVSAQGGGIRAAYWTATVLALLSEEVPDFDCALYAVSTSSGGNIGALVWRARLAEAYPGTGPGACARQRPSIELVGPVQRVLAQDLLSPVIGALLTRDLLGHFLPPLWEDRAAVFERGLEAAWRERDGDREPASDLRLSDDFRTLWGKASQRRDLPSLLLNATRQDTGAPAAVANFGWPATELDGGGAAGSGLDTYPLRRRVDHALAASTAAHAGARHPIVAPAASVRCPERPGERDAECRGRGGRIWDRVTDAGYFDNSGAFSALDLRQRIERLCGARCRFLHIAIVSDPHPPAVVPAASARSAPANRYGVLAPLVSLLRRGPAQEEILRERFLRTAGDRSFLICFHRTAQEPDPPLGWLLHERTRRHLGLQARERVPLEAIRRAIRGDDPGDEEGRHCV